MSSAGIVSVALDGGVAVRGTFPEAGVLDLIAKTAEGPLPLVIADPPHGNILAEGWDRVGDDDAVFATWMIDWTTCVEHRPLSRCDVTFMPGPGVERWRREACRGIAFVFA